MIAPANTLRAPKRSAIQLDSGMKIATARMQAVMPMFMSTGVMPNALAMVGNAVVMTEVTRCTGADAIAAVRRADRVCSDPYFSALSASVMYPACAPQ